MRFCVALSGQNTLLPTKPGALPQADLLWPVGPNRSVSVGFQEFAGLCGLPHFPMTSASPSHPRFLTRALHFAQNLFFVSGLKA